jgi:hypothetical protein
MECHGSWTTPNGYGFSVIPLGLSADRLRSFFWRPHFGFGLWQFNTEVKSRVLDVLRYNRNDCSTVVVLSRLE